MKLAEWQARITNNSYMNDVDLNQIKELICDLMTDAELTPNDKAALLKNTFSGKSITISSELNDEKIIPSLAALFQHTHSLKLVQCKVNATSMRILKTARALADSAYQVKNITARTVEVDLNILDQFSAWLSPNANYYRVEICKEGKLYVNAIPCTIARLEVEIADDTFTSTQCTQLLQSLPSKIDKHIILRACFPKDLIISDPTVKAVTICDLTMIYDIFSIRKDAYLRFISSKAAVTELILRNLRFVDIAARMSAIEQSFRIPGLTLLVLDFPLNDADLSYIMKLLSYSNSLTELNLPNGLFSETALQQLATTLSNANQRLVELTLPISITIPSELNKEL